MGHLYSTLPLLPKVAPAECEPVRSKVLSGAGPSNCQLLGKSPPTKTFTQSVSRQPSPTARVLVIQVLDLNDNPILESSRYRNGWSPPFSLDPISAVVFLDGDCGSSSPRRTLCRCLGHTTCTIQRANVTERHATDAAHPSISDKTTA